MGLAKELFKRIQDDDVAGISAELAYRLLFALFPFLILLAALSSYVANWMGVENPTQQIITDIGDTLPDDAASILESQLQNIFNNQNAGILSITAVAAIWTASSGTKTVMKALNRAYDVDESRPFIKKQAVGLLLTAVGGIAFIAGAIVLVAGQAAGQDIANSIGLGSTWATVVTWLRIPVVMILIAIGAAFVYWSAPAASLPWKWFSWGSLIFVVAWLVATLAFAFYVANFAEYANTYGALAGVIILMTWLYISAFVLILGAEVNVVLERRLAGSRLPEQEEAARRHRNEAAREVRQGSSEVATSGRSRPTPEEVQVERRTPPSTWSGARSQVSGATTALGAMVAGVVLLRLWR